jgi:hypothetical protein
MKYVNHIKITLAQDISSDKCLGGALNVYLCGTEYSEACEFCDDCPPPETVRNPAWVGDAKVWGKLK